MSNLPRPSRAGGLLAVALALAAALAWPGPPPAGAAEPPPLGLGMPLSCEIGKSCCIVNYVDLDKSKNVRDYNCGKSSYDGHKGVDFAISDMGVMRKGVPVLAAAEGTVAGLRDGMEDVDFNLIGGPRAVKGKECGNAVTLRHKDGWSTQYCHLRRGSVRVRKGQRVAAGERLGLVGHSGLAMFPHVHIQVRKGRKIVDPFVGAGPSKKCGPGVTPLWKRQVLAALPYQSTAIYSAGFSATKPEVRGVRDGKYQETELPRDTARLYLWAEIFRVRAGDRLTLTITGPDGKTLVRSSRTEKRDLARAFRPGGIPRPGGACQKASTVASLASPARPAPDGPGCSPRPARLPSARPPPSTRHVTGRAAWRGGATPAGGWSATPWRHRPRHRTAAPAAAKAPLAPLAPLAPVAPVAPVAPGTSR